MFRKLLLFIVIYTTAIYCFAQKEMEKGLDSSKQIFLNTNIPDTTFIKTCFFIADYYMDYDQYDSAQIWLNKIYTKVTYKKPSLFNYFLTTRQAEVYYYNNLQQLGLQESFKGLDIAKKLNDSLLLADSYNFLGLFYMNLDRIKESIPFYKEGLKYTRQPPYPANYLSLTKPHHLYGNMSEAYYKIQMYDSALYNIRLSLDKANQIEWGRGMAVGHVSAGDIFFAQHNIDSAFFHYQLATSTSIKSLDFDVELVSYSGMANCYHERNDYALANEYLHKGFTLLKEKPQTNRFYALQFLKSAIDIYKEHKDYVQLSNALEVKSNIEMANVKGSNEQIQTILNAGLKNETRLLNLEVEETKQKQKLTNTRLALAILLIFLMLLGFLLYRYNSIQKLNAIKLRNKISQDLHDDIGASLSSLQIYGTIVEQTLDTNPAKAKEMIGKMSAQAQYVMENINDIVWSMNSKGNSSISLASVIKNYGSELLAEKNIDCKYKIEEVVENDLQSAKARKNILLIIKEAMNNMAKYSKASTASISLELQGDYALLQIMDDGIGLQASDKSGNGLANIKQRVAELGGTTQISTGANKGTNFTIFIPRKSLRKA